MRLRRVLPIWLVLASLALGLLATAASVAVGAYLLDRETAHGVPFHLQRWEGLIDRRTHLVAISCIGRPGAESWDIEMLPIHPDTEDRSRGFMPTIDPADDRRPAMARVPYRGMEAYAWYSRAGWPLLAAEGIHAERYDMVATGEVFSTIDGLAWAKYNGDPLDIPMRPLPLGVLANTLFYATPTLILLATFRLTLIAWRTRHRRHRDRCAACGYEPGPGVTVCPECGSPRITTPPAMP